MSVAPLLVLGWGNLSRGDDALGPLCVAALRDTLPAHLQNQVEFLDDYQLQVEFALDLVGRKRVLFIDASLDCAAPFEVHGAGPRRDSSISSHALSPEALLQVFVDLHATPPPAASVLAIRGAAFALGEPLSARAQAHLDLALVWARDWLLKPAP
ncbi:MAG: hydrogenase maturation protease [Rhodoferax sp.]|nr:hydrogenase maturation protease [Rhodoferax sp.]